MELAESIAFTPFKPHLRYLLGYQAHHKNNNGCCKQKCTHIRKTAMGDICVKVVGQSKQKHDKTYWNEYPKWRIHGTYLRDNHEESYTVS